MAFMHNDLTKAALERFREKSKCWDIASSVRPLIEEFWAAELSAQLQEVREMLESARWEEPGGSFPGDPVREQWWGRECLINEMLHRLAALEGVETNQN